jgi:hypothetical protein
VFARIEELLDAQAEAEPSQGTAGLSLVGSGRKVQPR